MKIMAWYLSGSIKIINACMRNYLNYHGKHLREGKVLMSACLSGL
jgi:hypothetical protein